MDQKKEIKNMLPQIDKAITQELLNSQLGYIDRVKKAYPYLDFTKPEHLAIIQNLEFTTPFTIIIDETFDTQKLNVDERKILYFIYAQPKFVENHLKNLIETHEGHAFIMDKVRFLIQAYVDFAKSGVTPKIDPFKESHPKKGELQEWFDYIYATESLYGGDEAAYAKAKKTLRNHYENEEE